MPLTHDDVMSALKQCYDPEIPVNIVDLGLVYSLQIEQAAQGARLATVDAVVDGSELGVDLLTGSRD